MNLMVWLNLKYNFSLSFHFVIKQFIQIIVNTTQRGGNVIIPSFAVGRAQEIIYTLNYYIDIEKGVKKDIL